MIDIKDIQGNTILSTPINEGSIYRKKLMSEDYISLRFNTDTPIHFDRGYYTEWNGIGYEIVDLTYPNYNTSTGGYEYELRLDVYYWKWKNKILLYDRQNNNAGEASWHLTRNPQAHLDIICSNLKALDFNYNGKHFEYAIDSSVDQSAKLVSYDNINIIDALTLIAQTWEAEWWIEDNVIHLGRCEYNTAIEFEQDKNVQSMSRSESNDNFATRIYAFGSDRNLPANYRNTEGAVVNGIVQKRLMLPKDTPYIDAYDDLPLDQAVEAVVVFDDIYPRRIGTMSDVQPFEKTETIENEDGTTTQEKYTVYRYKDTGLTFKEEFIIPGRELRIVFTLGPLNGMEFGVLFNPDKKDESDPEAQLWEIVRNEDYGQFLPAGSLIPTNGNKYILSGFDTSYIDASGVGETYLSKAEKELKERAEKYVEKSKEDPSVYDCQMNMVDLINKDINLNVGDRVKLINPAYFDENGRKSRIYGFEKHLDGTQVTYTVGNTSKYSRLAQVENEIKEITYQGNSYSGTGGSGIYVIGRYDSTTPSDRNVFSALRSLNEFLNKNRDGEVVKGYIRFLKQLFIGENVIDSLVGGAGTIIDDGRIQTRRLEVEGSLTVLELIFNRQSAMESDYLFTEAGTVESVELLSDGTYRLPLRKEWENDFTALAENDCVYGIVNNLSTGGSDYKTSWLRVINVNTVSNHIIAVMYPDSEVPGGKNYPPEPLMILTHRGNPVNEDRQAYWYISSREKCICMLDGVTKPILEEHNYAIIIGKLKQLSLFDNLPINYRHSYVFCRGLAIQDLLRIRYNGLPAQMEINRGPWSFEVAQSDDPYRNISTEVHSVYHIGCKWMCLTDKTIESPKIFSTAWALIEGNTELSMRFGSSAGDMFFAGQVSTVVTPHVFLGNINISDDIFPADWQWKRDSGNVTEDNAWSVAHVSNGRELTLSNEDMGTSWQSTRKTAFICTAFVRDGEGNIKSGIENKIIA